MLNVRRFNLSLIFMLLPVAGLTACGVSTANATADSGVSADVFEAQQLLVAAPMPVTIVSELPGEIQVISYPAAEVALDVITTGHGATEDEAALQARQGVSITLHHTDGGVLIRVLRSAKPADQALLHVRVPDASSILVESPLADVKVVIAGKIQDAKVRVRHGDVFVQGATGHLNIHTERGAIAVDERGADVRQLDLKANAGNITIFALNVKVTAQTTNGSIRFVGTLRETSGDPAQGDTRSDFTVKGTGDITLALPDHAKYRYRAFGGARVITDLARNIEPCGFVSSTDYDFRRRSLGAGDVGRVEVGGTFTSTSQVQGTVGNGIVYFETDRKLITIFDPAARSGGPAAGGFVGNCGRFTTANLAVANIDFTARADSGSIWIHQIKMR